MGMAKIRKAEIQKLKEQPKARREAEKYITDGVNRVAKMMGFAGIDESCPENIEFIQSMTDITTSTQPGSKERAALLKAYFIASAYQTGGQEAAEEMGQVISKILA